MGMPPPLFVFVVGAVVGAVMTTGRRTGKMKKTSKFGVVRVGLEVARDEGWKVLRGRTVGLVTNPTGVMPSTMEHAVDVMHASGGAVDIRAVFGPEHGFRGNAQAGSSSGSSSASQQQQSDAPFTDPRTGLPVYDTYLKSGAELTAILSSSGVDTIAVDIQDVGARFYTYVWTLYDVMPPIAVVVFDRPNPLGGEVVEGPVIVDDACASFVGRKPIAVRHGMTFGELAWWGWGDDPKLSPTYPYQ